MPTSSRISRHFSKTAQRIPKETDRAVAPEIERVDESLQVAGLVRAHHSTSAKVARSARFPKKTQEELHPELAPIVTAPDGVQYVSVPGWDKIGWLWHGFSTRKGGVSTAYAPEGTSGELNLGFTAEDARENVIRNRKLLAEAVTGDPDTPIRTLRQVHSSVLVVSGSNEPAGPCKGDGLMTSEPGILVGVQTADCIPVLVADRKRRVVAAFHAGWRGTAKRIVECGIGRMRVEFGSRPEDLVAAIGPGIGACCYVVGEDLLSEFESQFSYARELFHEVSDSDVVRAKYPLLFLTQRAPGRSPVGQNLHLNLVEANRRQLLDAGVKPKGIQVVGGCTNCQHELFFSHRAAKGRSGRMLSVIGVRAG